MAYEYPAMPLGDPCGPEVEGFADVEITRDYVELTVAGGEKIRIPARTIQKWGVKVLPAVSGRPNDGEHLINRVQLTLFTGKIDIADDTEWVEVVPGKRRSA